MVAATLTGENRPGWHAPVGLPARETVCLPAARLAEFMELLEHDKRKPKHAGFVISKVWGWQTGRQARQRPCIERQNAVGGGNASMGPSHAWVYLLLLVSVLW